MIILGLNAYHPDAAACLMKDGELVAAAEEERFRRIKHWAGFPSDAIAYCLREAGLTLADVTHVAVNRNNRANFLRKIAYVATSRPQLSAIVGRLRNRSQWAAVADELRRAFPDQRFNGRVEHVEHHYAHLASAYYASPFADAAVVSVDGFGDFASAAWGSASGGRLSLEGRVLFPHSLGIFYQALTQFLGFPHYGDEYKVMGLAAYGAPDASLMQDVRRLVRLDTDGSFALDLRYFRHHKEDVGFEWSGGAPTFKPLFSDELERLLGPRRAAEQPVTDRHRNLALATQAVFEDALFSLLNALHKRYSHDVIALAGGCAYNSVANGKITDRTPFAKIYLQSAAGDAGGAIGAASAVWHSNNGRRMPAMAHGYWGPQFDDADTGKVVEDRQGEWTDQGIRCRRVASDDELAKAAASAIAEGLVVGWFQGRMEWGPRALGNRSILGDPRRAEMKDLLNAKIKRRESFRPFAPSVLRECVAEWFEKDDDVPFMMQVFPIRKEKRPQIPAVTHVDGTGRLHTVEREANPRYHALIEAFHALTGVPMVLNTSFNENEPVVCRPEEAIDCFLRTQMDVLFLGNFMLSRSTHTADLMQANHA